MMAALFAAFALTPKFEGSWLIPEEEEARARARSLNHDVQLNTRDATRR